MRLKGCFGQFQTRGIGRETYGAYFDSPERLWVELLLAWVPGLAASRSKGFVTSSQVCRVFLDRGNGSGQPPSVIAVVIYFHEGDHSLGFLAHLGMASPSHVHKLVPTRLNDCPGSSQSIVQATRINDLYQVNDVCSIEPELLEKFAQAVPDALVGVANAEQKEPPGFRGALKIFRSENLRRGLAVMNNLLEAWGRNFST
jgi:hypothetical protein